MGRVVYQWDSGSVPPPHHFEIRVIVESDGAGRLWCRPDYEFNSPPQWEWDFDVSSSMVAQLQSEIADFSSGLASEEAEPLTVGGERGTVAIQGRDEVSEFAATDELSTVIRRAVPRTVWEDLARRRQDYEESSADQSPG